MNCLSPQELEAYLDDRLAQTDRQKWEQHLDHCPRCQQQLEAYIDCLAQANEPWAETISADLEQKVIQSLSPHPVSILSRTADARTATPARQKKRSMTVMKNVSIAAAALALVVSGGMLVSPTFSSYVNAAFASKPLNNQAPAPAVSKTILGQFGDDGIRQAVQNGFTQFPQAQVTDQGITFAVQEVIADPLRIQLAASITDQAGKPLEVFWQDMYQQGAKKPVVTLKDKQGNILQPADFAEAGRWENPNDEWKSQRNMAGQLFLERELKTYFPDASKIPDELVVEFSIQQMDETKGNWKLSVPVNMQKAKAATRSQAIHKSYTTPQGITFTLQEMTFAPTGVELVIDRSANTDKSASYSYELVDDRGTVIAARDPQMFTARVNKSQNDIRSMSDVPFQSIEGGYRNFHYFQPIDPKTKLSFKLGSVYTEEPTDFRVKIDLEQLEKQPVLAADHEDRFTFKKFVKDPDRAVDVEGYDDGAYKVNPDGTTTKIEGHHIAYDITLGKNTAPLLTAPAYWTITDETGKEHDTDFYTDKSELVNGLAHFAGTMLVKDSEPLPKELIITSTKRMVKHDDAEWQVRILNGK